MNTQQSNGLQGTYPPAGLLSEYIQANVKFTSISNAAEHMRSIFDVMRRIDDTTKYGFQFRPCLAVSIDATSGKASLVLDRLDDAIAHTKKTLGLLMLLKEMQNGIMNDEHGLPVVSDI